MPETAGIKLRGPTPAWLDKELPGFGTLVTVTPEAELAALLAVGAADSGRANGEADVAGLADGAASEFAEVAGDEAAVAVGRSFLLDRSTEPID